MTLPFELLLGWRYIRAGRATRRNGFISFISAASMLGIALGVAALIIVLSVVNGFQKEVRERMLGVVSHIEIYSADGAALADPQAVMAQARQHPQVLGAAPFVAGQALLARGEQMRGVLVRGIEPQLEPQVADVAAGNMPVLQRLGAGSFQIAAGVQLAHSMALFDGDVVALVTPGGQMTPAGMVPRIKQVTVAGLFDSGHYEYDAGLVMMHASDAARLFQTGGATGVRLKLRHLDDAPFVAQELAAELGPQVLVTNWTQQNRSWFAAAQIEKRMLFIILTLIVAVAAFNLVSTLVMSVQDKRADIAILRTLGATPRSVMRIFMVQGAVSGIIGTLAGLLLGLLVACNIDVIVPFIERLLHTRFLPADVYLISQMPSDPQAADIAPVVIVSLLLSFVATLYPSWRASRLNPAQALRYE